MIGGEILNLNEVSESSPDQLGIHAIVPQHFCTPLCFSKSRFHLKSVFDFSKCKKVFILTLICLLIRI